MKKFFSIIALFLLAMGLVTSEALALSFDFSGKFEFLNKDSDSFAEVLSIKKSFIQWATPDFDDVLDDGSYVEFSPFYFNQGAYISGVSYSFLDNPYEDGFKVFNSAGALLMQADITLDPLQVLGGTGSINANFAINLANVDIVMAGSPILDAFASGGAVNFTLNVASSVLSQMIENVQNSPDNRGSYSGSAAPVPEPSTVLLLGAGMLGLVAFGRKHLKK